MKYKRGVFFSIDAMIALIVILLVILLVIPTSKYTNHSTEVHRDLIETLSTLKIGEVNNSYVQGLILDGKINDLNKSLLEQIGEFYVTNISLAREVTSRLLNELNLTYNLGIWYDNSLIFSSNKTPYEGATNVDTARQIISGIGEEGPPTGFVSKAWLRKIANKKTSLIIKGDLICGRWTTYGWGDYCGVTPTTVDYNFKIPENASIVNAFWLAEPSWVGQSTKLSVNGVTIFDGVINYFETINITSNLHVGNNIATLMGDIGGDDGASHIVIEYFTPDLQTYQFEETFQFNNVKAKSTLYHDKSIFLVNPVYSIDVFINSTSKTELSIRRGAQTFVVGAKNPVNDMINFTNAEIAAAFSVNNISYSEINNEYFFFILKVGIVNPNKDVELGTNSYIRVVTDKINVPFGSIDLTQKIRIDEVSDHWTNTFYRHLVWKFDLPKNAIPIIADWQLGWLAGGSQSGQKASANGIVLYQYPPNSYLPSFSRFGYTPSKTTGLFLNGSNNFTLDFDTNYGVSNESSYGAVSYFIRSFVNYGNTFEKAKGGELTLQFEDGSQRQFIVGDSQDSWDPSIDAVDDSVTRLLSQLDADADGLIDIILDQDNFEIDTLDISGVPYLWSTEVQIRVWY